MAKANKKAVQVVDLFGSVQVVPEVKPEPKKVIEQKPVNLVITHMEPINEVITVKEKVVPIEDKLMPGTAEYTAKWFPNGPTSLKQLRERGKNKK